MKRTSLAAERNKEPIFNVLKIYLGGCERLLEIGTGTGQHAVYFSKNFKGLHWVTSDVEENHEGITALLREEKIKNVHGPETLKIGVDDFPKGAFDAVFTANTLHIMSWKENKTFFKLLGKRLREDALVFFYGPFNYNGQFTSESNEEFDRWLKTQVDEKSGIRNFEDVDKCMKNSGFELVRDHEMPANNRILVFKKLAYNG